MGSRSKPSGKPAAAAGSKATVAPSTLGLGDLGDLSGFLAAPSPLASEPTGAAMEIPIDLIDEDPSQPRQHFDRSKLDELAATIRERGVKTPISVRPHPHSEGRYIINHGARRYRASKLAGKTTIPGFVDADYSEADQVIENLQRDELTSREIADYIGRQLASGLTKSEIARAIGKSPAYVTQHSALLDMPDLIGEIFQSGRCKDITIIYDLVGLYKKNPEFVTDWAADQHMDITRRSVRHLKDKLEIAHTLPRTGSGGHESEPAGQPESSGQSEPSGQPEAQSADEDAGRSSSRGIAPKGSKVAARENAKTQELPKQGAPSGPHASPATSSDGDRLTKAILQIRHQDRAGQLVLDRRPSRSGHSWIKYEDDGSEIEAALADVLLIDLVEG